MNRHPPPIVDGPGPATAAPRARGTLRHRIAQLLRPSALPRPGYDVPPRRILATLARASVVKSLRWSIACRGPVLVGRGSRIRVARDARIRLEPGAILAIGLEHPSPVGAALELRPRSELRIEGFVQLMRATVVRLNWDAVLTIGDRTFLNGGAEIDCGGRMTLGRGCAIAGGSALLSTDTHRLEADGTPSHPHAAVTVGDDCWIGTRAVVLKGVRIGDGAVVAAGSVVTRDVAPRQLVAGVPARPVREGVEWTL